MLKPEADKILIEATDSRQAIRDLYNCHKTRNPKYSVGYLAKLTNIPSRGYVWDAITGKKTIGPTYRERVFRAFDLTMLQAAILRTLVEIDNQEDELYITHLQNKLKALRGLLQEGSQSSFTPLEYAFLDLRFRIGIPRWIRSKNNLEEIWRNDFNDLSDEQRTLLMDKLQATGVIIEANGERKLKPLELSEAESQLSYDSMIDDGIKEIIQLLKSLQKEILNMS